MFWSTTVSIITEFISVVAFLICQSTVVDNLATALWTGTVDFSTIDEVQKPNKSSPLDVLTTSLYSSRAPTSSHHQLLPDSPASLCCHCWRRPNLTLHRRWITDRSPTCQPSPRLSRQRIVSTRLRPHRLGEDDLIPSRCYTACTGCRWRKGSCIQDGSDHGSADRMNGAISGSIKSMMAVGRHLGKLLRHRTVSLRRHGFLVKTRLKTPLFHSS